MINPNMEGETPALHLTLHVGVNFEKNFKKAILTY
jgi:hypothetical protein